MIRRARPLLGTLVDIQATGGHTVAAVEAAFSAIAEVHRLMSFHEPQSDVSRINRSDTSTPIAISPQTYEVLHFAQQISALSDGAFDVTVADKLVRAGFLPQPAHAETIAPDASYRDLTLLPSSQVLLKKRAWIDLGGIAKGYAVDGAIAALQAHGVESALVNAGGDLRFFGQAQSIKIRHPNQPTAFVSLGVLENCAVATSAGYFSSSHRIDSQIDPLVDPTSQACIRWDQSVSVIAPSCIMADALTKVVRLLPQRAQQILDDFDAYAVQLDQHGFTTCDAYAQEKALTA